MWIMYYGSRVSTPSEIVETIETIPCLKNSDKSLVTFAKVLGLCEIPIENDRKDALQRAMDLIEKLA